MEGSGSSGFDMSKMSTAEKLMAGGSILLLLDSFLPWQKFCADLGGPRRQSLRRLGRPRGKAAEASSGSSWASVPSP